MNTRINYKWNENEEINSIVTDGVYDLGDWLSDNGVSYEYEKSTDTYYVLDECKERTGETYTVISTEDTEEEIRG